MDDLVDRALRLSALRPPGPQRAILGITGAPGAGKSRMATALVERLRISSGPQTAPDWVVCVPMDGFHLDDAELDLLGLRERKGAPETFDVHGYLHALRRIRHDRRHTVYLPAFDRTAERAVAGVIAVRPTTTLVVTEGNYLLHDEGMWAPVRGELDESWYVDADDEQRREQLTERHIRYGKTPQHARRWVRASDEPNAALVARTRWRADLIVSQHGWAVG